VRILSAESPRFPGEGSSAQGKSGPKARPKGVVEGQQVEIPVPPTSRLSEGVTQEAEGSGRMEEAVQAASEGCRQIRTLLIVSCDGEGSTVPKSRKSHCQEKPLASDEVPVPETDTGGRVENTKARGRTLVKELGKMAP
jgi:hypothetical protein